MARFRDKDVLVATGEELLLGDNQEASIKWDGSNIVINRNIYTSATPISGSHLSTITYVDDEITDLRTYVDGVVTGLQWQEAVLSMTTSIPTTGNFGDRYISPSGSILTGWTFDENAKGPNIVLSNGDLTAYGGSTGWQSVYVHSWEYIDSGRYYWEVTCDSDDGIMIGCQGSRGTTSNHIGSQADGYAYFSDSGQKWNANGGSAYGDTYTAGDIIGVAVDLVSGYIFFSKNGVWQNSGDPETGTNPAYSLSLGNPHYPAVSTYFFDSQATANFGATSFTYSIPSGYTSLPTSGSVSPYDVDNIVEWYNSTWNETIPSAGFACWVVDQGAYFVYNGTIWARLGSVVDHGQLDGLGDDDHTQYILADGTRDITGDFTIDANLTVTGSVTAAEFQVNQGAEDDEAILFRSSDVDHGATNVAETDVYGHIAKHSAAEGGVGLWGFSESTVASSIWSYYGEGSGDTSKDSTALGAITLYPIQISGADYGGVSVDDNLFVVRPYRSGEAFRSVFVVDGYGDVYLAGDINSMSNTISFLTSAGDGFVIQSDGYTTFTDSVCATYYYGDGSQLDNLTTMDHGSLNGLIDDDHNQYLLADGSRSMTGTLSVSTTGSSLRFTEDLAYIGVTSNIDLMTLAPTAVTIDGDVYCNTLHASASSVVIGTITLSDDNGTLIVNGDISAPSGSGLVTKDYVDDGLATKSDLGHDHDTEYYTQAVADATFAAIADGVTGGDSHDHSGGDGAQIDHTGLANKGTKTHAQIDDHIALTGEHIDWTDATDNLLTTGNISGSVFYGDGSNLTSVLANLVSDTSPQLGGNLDLNDFDIQLIASPSSDHTTSGDTTTMHVTANSVGFGAILFMTSGGQGLSEADASNYWKMPVRALALEAGTGTKNILLKGFIRDDSWNWTPGLNVYASETVGTMTQVAPTASGVQAQVLGWAYSADVIYFEPNRAVLEIT